jgi:hypothetical protein
MLHDVGHAPFSHAPEEVLANRDDRPEKYKHQHYSAAIVRMKLNSAIEGHELNANYGFRAEEVAALLEGSSQAKQRLFWRDPIDGRMDADRISSSRTERRDAGLPGTAAQCLHRRLGTGRLGEALPRHRGRNSVPVLSQKAELPPSLTLK